MRSLPLEQPKLPVSRFSKIRPFICLILGTLGTWLILDWNLKRDQELQAQHVIRIELQRRLAGDSRFAGLRVGYDARTNSIPIEGTVPQGRDLEDLSLILAQEHLPKSTKWRVLVRVQGTSVHRPTVQREWPDQSGPQALWQVR